MKMTRPMSATVGAAMRRHRRHVRTRAAGSSHGLHHAHLRFMRSVVSAVLITGKGMLLRVLRAEYFRVALPMATVCGELSVNKASASSIVDCENIAFLATRYMVGVNARD